MARVQMVFRHSARSSRRNGIGRDWAAVGRARMVVVIGAPPGCAYLPVQAAGLVSVKKRSSSSACSAGRSSRRESPAVTASAAIWAALTPALVSTRSAPPGAWVNGTACVGQEPPQRRRPAARTIRPLAGTMSLRAPAATISAGVDDHQVVGGGLHLGQQVAGQQHGAAPLGEVAQQAADPGDTVRVEAGGGLIEDQHAWFGDEGLGQAEPLAHPERVGAHPPAGRAGQADGRQHLVHAAGRHPGQVAAIRSGAAGPPGVQRGGVQQGAGDSRRVRQFGEPVPGDGGLPGVGPGQAGERAQGRGLAGAVGAEEPGNGARHAGERHPVHRDDPPVALAESGYLDHASSLLSASRPAHRRHGYDARSARRTAAGPAPAAGGDSRARPATFVDAARDDRRYRGPGQVPRLEVWLKADHGPGGTWPRTQAG